MKYQIIGSPTQVAITETNYNLNLAKKIFNHTTFSNGRMALVVMQTRTLREARNWLERSNTLLAVASGRLGRWITPTFFIKEK